MKGVVRTMQLHTYLNYPGTCRTAFEFYQQKLGGKITSIMTHGQVPNSPGLTPGWEDKVLHARIDLGETYLMGADIPNAEPIRSAYITLSFDSSEETERIHDLLAEGGEIFMPLVETFFAFRFSMLRDQFGTSWMLIHERPMPTAH